jgi:hypothetical protein
MGPIRVLLLWHGDLEFLPIRNAFFPAVSVAATLRLRVELRKLSASPNGIRIIKSRKLRWADHVARMGEINTYKILV